MCFGTWKLGAINILTVSGTVSSQVRQAYDTYKFLNCQSCARSATEVRNCVSVSPSINSCFGLFAYVCKNLVLAVEHELADNEGIFFRSVANDGTTHGQ